MKDVGDPSEDLRLPPTLAGRIDQVADRFERAWRSGDVPSLEEYLDGFPTEGRDALFRKLIALDLEYRLQSGEMPTIDTYATRFSESEHLIAASFRELPDIANGRAREDLEPPADEHQQIAEFARFSVGKVVAGDYEIIEELGRGGMGRVYKVRHLQLGKIVALKVLHEHMVGDPSIVARFRRERLASGRLNHPHIVSATDAREEGGYLYLIMEYLEGTDLAKLVRRRGPLPFASACELTRQAAVGLEHVHQSGLVHRDVKPSNLLLTHDGTVKLLDLGLARLRLKPEEEHFSMRTMVSQIIGTLDFMPPEQFESSQVDIRADIYALGCTLFQLLTGDPPFSGPRFRSRMDKMNAHMRETPPRIRDRGPDIPDALQTVLDRMLAKAPADRYRSPGEVARALAPFSIGHCVNAIAVDAWGQGEARGNPGALTSTRDYPNHDGPQPPTDPDKQGHIQDDGQATTDRHSNTSWRRIRKSRLRLVGVALGVLVLGVYLSIWTGAWSPFGTASGPVRVDSLVVERFRDRGAGEAPLILGAIGPLEPEAAADDLVRISAKLKRPAYCYLVAFNPDGSLQLCYPPNEAGTPDESTAPKRTAQVDYPSRQGKYFALTDGRGQQAFVLFASRDPLPPFADWRSRIEGASWSGDAHQGVWAIDDNDIHPVLPKDGSKRGTEVDRKPERLAALGAFLKAKAGVDHVSGLAFPVR